MDILENEVKVGDYVVTTNMKGASLIIGLVVKTSVSSVTIIEVTVGNHLRTYADTKRTYNFIKIGEVPEKVRLRGNDLFAKYIENGGTCSYGG